MQTSSLGFVAALLTIAIFNMVLFPLVFTDGVPVLYACVRPAPLFQYNLLAFIVTAAGLVALLRLAKPQPASQQD